jgi:uncharacterized protein YcfJ
MRLMHTISFSSAAVLCALCGSAGATEYGTVVSSTPVLGQVAVPERNCYDEQVAVARPPSGGGALVGALIGGAVGNTVGAGMGRAAATALGAVTGAAIGNQAEANGTPPAAATVQRCRTTTRQEDRLVGYDVVYEYAGTQRTARLAQDPGAPGTRIALDINVAPSAAPSRGGRYGTPVPPTAGYGRPVGQPAEPAYEDEAPRVYSQGYYAAPPPAYYYTPGPVVYYGAPTVWIGGRWVYRNGYRHW